MPMLRRLPVHAPVPAMLWAPLPLKSTSGAETVPLLVKVAPLNRNAEANPPWSTAVLFTVMIPFTTKTWKPLICNTAPEASVRFKAPSVVVTLTWCPVFIVTSSPPPGKPTPPQVAALSQSPDCTLLKFAACTAGAVNNNIPTQAVSSPTESVGHTLCRWLRVDNPVHTARVVNKVLCIPETLCVSMAMTPWFEWWRCFIASRVTDQAFHDAALVHLAQIPTLYRYSGGELQGITLGGEKRGKLSRFSIHHFSFIICHCRSILRFVA